MDNLHTSNNFFKPAFKGLVTAFMEEKSLRIQAVIALMIIVSGIVFNISELEWISLLLCMGLVIGLELINSALENLVDLVSPEFNPIAGKVKDIGASAALFAAIIAIGCGTLIFLPKIIVYFNGYLHG